jgi:hypothetical protein
MSGPRLAFAVALLCAAPAVANSPVRATGKPGTLIVESVTEGAEVFVDGAKVGVVPLPGPVPLPLGEHTIKVVKPGFAPLIDVFTITKKRPAKVEVELVPISGVLRVTANIEKAKVYVDGKFVGEAPLTAEVPVGAAAVQVSRGGYKDFFQNVASVAGQEVALDVKLEELPMGLNPYKPAPPPPRKTYEKWWVWTLAVAGVGAVVTVVVVPLYKVCRDPVQCFNPDVNLSATVPPAAKN